jgi:hypothetical protein
LKAELKQGTGDAAEKADAARKMHDDWKEHHKHLYDCLSILDVKAAALLQFDAILIATLSLVLTLQSASSWWVKFAVVAALLFAAVSTATTLTVIYVKWTEVSQLGCETTYATHLRDVVDKRTIRYRLAWSLALLSLVFLAPGVALLQIAPGAQAPMSSCHASGHRC